MVIALVLVAKVAMAQTVDTVLSRKITLSDTKKDIKLNPKYPVAGIEVTQFLWDSLHLGFAQVGLLNDRAVAVPDKPVTSYLQDYTQSAFGHLFKNEGLRMLWVIEALRVGEKTNPMNEDGFFRFKGTSFVTKDGISYLPVFTYDIVTRSAGMDVTHKHKNHIASAMDKLMQLSMDKLDSAFASNGGMFTHEQIMGQYQQKRALPILTEKMKDGVYLQYNDLKNNTPAITSFTVEKVKRKTLVKDSTGKTIDYWAVVKGGVVYKYDVRGLIALEKYQYGYIISSYIGNAQRLNTAVAFGGGILGALAAGKGSTLILPADAYPSLFIQPEATAIDMETGAYIF
ncbi:hypothetical protein [Chitinophaga sp. Cy-1792]|uniref:hypothetical protein n=1 Tax=Chitinophaga sp. Cy-1792 TaxID=2608339 RepID=UPI00141F4657|nr:hypothetical protein [Chitinophaga sp. Cy-1792]NIG52421.1 hypothetical protein [Chitinophaga sp. Cy-1792]